MSPQDRTPSGQAHAGPQSKALLDIETFLAYLRVVLEQSRYEPSWAGPATEEPWITIADAATYAAVSEDTVREWIARGLLPNRRVGRVQRLRRSDIDALFHSGDSATPANDQESAHPRSMEIIESVKAKQNG